MWNPFGNRRSVVEVVEVDKSEKGRWRWLARAEGTGRVVAVSPTGWANQENAADAGRAVFPNASFRIGQRSLGGR